MMRNAIPFIALAFASAGYPARADQGRLPIEQRFTAEQLRATGLDRLTPDEIALLNRLLEQERSGETAETLGLRGARADATASLSVESPIRGDFRGWSAGTVIELENGQAWRVLEGELATRRMTAPKARISQGLLGSWQLQVEGQSVRARVRRIR